MIFTSFILLMLKGYLKIKMFPRITIAFKKIISLAELFCQKDNIYFEFLNHQNRLEWQNTDFSQLKGTWFFTTNSNCLSPAINAVWTYLYICVVQCLRI